MAGPVFAAAVSFDSNFKIEGSKLEQIKDSKKLSPKKREELFNILVNHPKVKWEVASVSEKIIDKINIFEATKLAMKKAVEKLKIKINQEEKGRKSKRKKELKNFNLEKILKENLRRISQKNSKEIWKQNWEETLKQPLGNSSVPNFHDRENLGQRSFLILDGNFKIKIDTPQKSIIKADEKVFSVAAASIIAKVFRDKKMEKYHKDYPQYKFNKHKGYPTAFHLQLLEKYGFCRIHRKTFAPCKK